MTDFCNDCPDREACWQGMSCDLSRKFATAAELYRQKMRGNTMSANAKNNVTPQDVAAKAAEEKLVVPAQSENEKIEVTVTAEASGSNPENPELKIIVGGKKSLKERLAEVTVKVKENRKALLALGAAAGVAGLAFAKYAKKKAEEALVEVEIETTEEVIVDEPAA